MTSTNLRPTPMIAGIDAIRLQEFIAEQAAGLTPPTRERYGAVADALCVFLDTVDVRPRLGAEIARHLNASRERLGPGAFLPTLGIESLVRLLPEFLDDPWLPPKGAQRRAHRVVVDRLLTFLRRGLSDPRLLREDLRRLRDAVSTARARDYDLWKGDLAQEDETVTVTVTLDLRVSTVDLLLDGVERGRHDSLVEAIQKSVDPDPDRYDRMYY